MLRSRTCCLKRTRILKDDERIDAGREVAPHRIGTGDVGEKGAVRRGGGGRWIELEGDVVGVEAGRREGDERAERMCRHEGVHHVGTGFGEVGGRIHAATKRRGGKTAVAPRCPAGCLAHSSGDFHEGLRHAVDLDQDIAGGKRSGGGLDDDGGGARRQLDEAGGIRGLFIEGAPARIRPG